MDTKEQVLSKCTVEGTVIKLPASPIPLDRKLYLEVAKSLELIGGKWKGNKIMGFVFPTDPTELLNQIAGGDKRNLKKEFQFFGTPDALADELVILANIQKEHTVLEPSAGQGAIIKAIQRHLPKSVDYCELMPINQTFLNKIPFTTMVCEDFLNIPFNCTNFYDRIIANPPFNKNQDIDHVRKMYEVLKIGGRLVSITSTHWQSSSNKKETEFRNWLDKVEAVIQEVPAGTFKESGTNIKTCILIIDK